MTGKTSCSDAHWESLWDTFNRNKTDDIRVKKAALADVCRCHGETPKGLITVEPGLNSETVLVNRVALFDFLNHHGATRCDTITGEKQ